MPIAQAEEGVQVDVAVQGNAQVADLDARDGSVWPGGAGGRSPGASLSVTAQGLAAVIGHHVAEGVDEVHRGAAFGPVQLEVGPVQVTHDPFGIKKIFEFPEVGGTSGLQRG